MAGPALLTGMQMASQVIGTVSDLGLEKTQAKMLRQAQRHRNTMLALSSALQTNSVTLSEIATQDQSRQLSEALQTASMENKANAEVSAAAAGVAGGSVEGTMRGLERSFLRANSARLRNTASAMRSHGQDRKNITLNRIFNEDNTVIPSPSVSMALMGLGTKLLDTYQQNRIP